MAVGCLLVLVGGILGALWAYFGLLPAMPVVGGGHSHNDLFIAAEVIILGSLLGAVLGPKVLGAMLRARERRRVDRLNGAVSPSLRPAVAYFCGFLVGAFASFASFYYSTCIAKLKPELGGPVSNVDPAFRAGATLVLAIVFAIASGILLFRGVRSLR
jgi:hypothetical protein